MTNQTHSVSSNPLLRGRAGAEEAPLTPAGISQIQRTSGVMSAVMQSAGIPEESVRPLLASEEDVGEEVETSSTDSARTQPDKRFRPISVMSVRETPTAAQFPLGIGEVSDESLRSTPVMLAREFALLSGAGNRPFVTPFFVQPPSAQTAPPSLLLRAPFTDAERRVLKNAAGSSYPIIAIDQGPFPPSRIATDLDESPPSVRVEMDLTRFLLSENFLDERQPGCCTEMGQEDFNVHVNTREHLLRVAEKIKRFIPMDQNASRFLCLDCPANLSRDGLASHLQNRRHVLKAANMRLKDNALEPL